MIVVDSSAMVAILKKEPEGPSFLAALKAADRAIISAVNVHEAGMVLRARLGPDGAKDLHDLLGTLDIETVAFAATDARASLDAFERYGKGLPTSAGDLNLCDCVAYALAKSLDASSPHKGDDFARKDLTPCL